MTQLRSRGVGPSVALALALALGAASCSYLDVKQREIIFRAQKVAAEALVAVAPGAQEFWIDVPDTTDRLHALWWPSARPDAPSVLFLHGVRRDMTGNTYRMSRLQSMGFNVLAIDYRGFGRSGGDTPQEQWTYEDAELAWAQLRARAPDPAKRYIYGHSLGGAVAIELATRVNDAAGLIVESTFTSIGDMAELTWARYLPVRLILTQHYDSMVKIAKVRIPTLFVHGRSDRFVPYQMSERLYAAATGPKRMLLVDNANHGNVLWSGFDAYQAAVLELVALTRAPPPGSRRSAASVVSATHGN